TSPTCALSSPLSLHAALPIWDLRTIQSFFAYSNLDPANIRNQADHGGGGLMDIGCYNISLSRFIFDAEPARVCATADYHASLKTAHEHTSQLDSRRDTACCTC